MHLARKNLLQALTVRRLVADQRGATAMEYALLIALIAIAAAGSLQMVGQHERASFANAAAAMPSGTSISVDDGVP
ncbi:MAG: Flp family type IVb pilin [Sphingomonadaceae bacterium]|nr:Flp family type IVb pilin [Sphingomonadaceae bacterium]